MENCDVKFTCLVTSVTAEPSQLLQRSFENQTFALSEEQSLALHVDIETKGELVTTLVPVRLQSSTIVSNRLISEGCPHKLIVETIDKNFFPLCFWWLDERDGVLIYRPSFSKLTVNMKVRVMFSECDFSME
jgi:hypothetical protein